MNTHFIMVCWHHTGKKTFYRECMNPDSPEVLQRTFLVEKNAKDFEIRNKISSPEEFKEKYVKMLHNFSKSQIPNGYDRSMLLSVYSLDILKTYLDTNGTATIVVVAPHPSKKYEYINSIKKRAIERNSEVEQESYEYMVKYFDRDLKRLLVFLKRYPNIKLLYVKDSKSLSQVALSIINERLD